MLKHIELDKELSDFIKEISKKNKCSESQYIRNLILFEYNEFICEKENFLLREAVKIMPELATDRKLGFGLIKKVKQGEWMAKEVSEFLEGKRKLL